MSQLVLKNQNLTEIPFDAENVSEITELDLSDNNLEDLEGIDQFKNVEKLDISSN